MSDIFSKPSKTIDEQIAHLRNCGLVIQNEGNARYWLHNISYYRLSAYWHSLQLPGCDDENRFSPGCRFEDVTRLYDFDRKFRRLVMRATEHVEVVLRGSWAYQLALLEAGHSYLDPLLYKSRNQYFENLAKLTSDIARSKEEYIKHYREKYSQPALPPVWMVSEMMSFGQLSRWYSSLKSRALRNKIAKPFGLYEAVMVPFAHHITTVRNICAHHARLWNREFRISASLPEQPEGLSLSLDFSYVGNRPAKIYNSITILSFLLKQIVPESSWTEDMVSLINQYPQINYEAMGFPQNWRDRPIWADAEEKI